MARSTRRRSSRADRYGRRRSPPADRRPPRPHPAASPPGATGPLGSVAPVRPGHRPGSGLQGHGRNSGAARTSLQGQRHHPLLPGSPRTASREPRCDVQPAPRPGPVTASGRRPPPWSRMVTAAAGSLTTRPVTGRHPVRHGPPPGPPPGRPPPGPPRPTRRRRRWPLVAGIVLLAVVVALGTAVDECVRRA